MLNVRRLIDQFKTLVAIDSVSGCEDKMRDFLMQEFNRRGYSAEEDQAGEIVKGKSGNLLVRIPGSIDAPAILFAAHMDTVEPGRGIKAVVSETDGIIRSEGDTILAADDKAAIAAIIEACDVLEEQHLEHPPIELLFTVGEEQGLQGSKLFDYSKLRARLAYVLDAGGDPGTIIVQSPCQNEIEYIVWGKSAHAGINPEDGINAIQLAAQALAAMPCGRIDNETTCNIGIISGGRARNIVADYCQVKGEARSLNREKLNQLTSVLRDTFISEVEKRGGKAEVKVDFLYPETKLDIDSEVIRIAIQAALASGLKPVLTATGGGSDASIINGNGIPCANLGTGMQAVHTIGEYIKVEDLISVARWILAIIKEVNNRS